MTQVNEWQVSNRCIKQTQDTDNMPRELRQCVHDYGYAIVRAFIDCGITKPNKIRHLVKEVWAGARQPQQKTGNINSSSVMKQLDWLLLQAGSEVSAAKLVRFLFDNNWAIVPITPNAAMTNASLAEVSGYNEIMSKPEKHRRRLIAAITAANKSHFPHLYTNEQLKGDAA